MNRSTQNKVLDKATSCVFRPNFPFGVGCLLTAKLKLLSCDILKCQFRFSIILFASLVVTLIFHATLPTFDHNLVT